MSVKTGQVIVAQGKVPSLGFERRLQLPIRCDPFMMELEASEPKGVNHEFGIVFRNPRPLTPGAACA